MAREENQRVKVWLRDVEDSDIAAFFEHQLDPEATDMAAFPSRDRAAFEAHWKKIRAHDSNLTKTVLLDGVVAGNIVCWTQEDERLVGYWIGKEFWGRGVAGRALSALLEIERTRPLRARVAKHNKGSIRVLEKCGFKVIGEEESALFGEEPVVEFLYELS